MQCLWGWEEKIKEKEKKNNAFFQHKILLALLPEGLHIPM